MSDLPPAPATVQPSPADGATIIAARARGRALNPRYAELYYAYQRVYSNVGTLERALDPPSETMKRTDAWVGPQARDWDDTLETQRQALRRAAAHVLWDIYNVLVNTPAFISLTQAEATPPPLRHN
jgi:hypothetical protein